MKELRLSKGGWAMLAVCILVLGHGIVLYRLSSKVTWSIVVGLILLLLLKHIGLFGSIYVFLKRRS